MSNRPANWQSAAWDKIVNPVLNPRDKDCCFTFACNVASAAYGYEILSFCTPWSAGGREFLVKTFKGTREAMDVFLKYADLVDVVPNVAPDCSIVTFALGDKVVRSGIIWGPSIITLRSDGKVAELPRSIADRAWQDK